MKKFNVAVVGATGAVGEEIFRILEERNFPINKLVPLASARSVGREISYKGETYKVQELTHNVLRKRILKLRFSLLEEVLVLNLHLVLLRLALL